MHKNPVNNGINYQPQLVSRISEPSTVRVQFSATDWTCGGENKTSRGSRISVSRTRCTNRTQVSGLPVSAWVFWLCAETNLRPTIYNVEKGLRARGPVNNSTIFHVPNLFEGRVINHFPALNGCFNWRMNDKITLESNLYRKWLSNKNFHPSILNCFFGLPHFQKGTRE